MEQKINKLAYFLVSLVIFLMPIWTIPGISGSVALHKMFLFLLASAILVFLWAARTVVTKRVWLALTPLNLSLLGLGVATAVSALFERNPLLHLSGRFLLVAASAVFLLFATSLVPKLRWRSILQLWVWSGVILSAFTFLQLTPLSPSIWMNRLLGTAVPEGLLYSLADNHLILMTFLFPTGLAGLVAGISALKEKKLTNWRAFASSPIPWSLICLVAAVVILAMTLTQTQLGVAFLPFNQGWQIFIENLKALRQTLLGVGPENFGPAFHRFRNVSINGTDLWNIRFTSSSSEFLHSGSTTGLVSLVIWGVLWLFTLDGLRRTWRKQPSLAIFVLAHLVLFFFMPFNHLLFFTLSIGLLALSTEREAQHPGYIKDFIFLLSAVRIVQPGALKTVKTQAGFSLLSALVLAGAAAAGLFFAGRVYAASIFFELSRQAAARSDVRGIYQYQQYSAIFNPYNPLYHRTYALTNLSIAKSLASQPDLTEEQRVLVGRIIQQSIREARLATVLNPQETENWEALASIYSQILDVEGAQQWALAAMVQAIQTDPVSPGLRLNLGNLYLILKDYDLALRLIEQAIQLKPDFGNSYISYGTVLELRDEPALSAQAYKRALDLLGPGFDGADQLRQKIDTMEIAARQREETQKAKDEAAKKAIPQAGEPTLPAEQPSQQNPPDDFGSIVEGKKPENSQVAPEPTPVVLPSDVGF